MDIHEQTPPVHFLGKGGAISIEAGSLHEAGNRSKMDGHTRAGASAHVLEIGMVKVFLCVSPATISIRRRSVSTFRRSLQWRFLGRMARRSSTTLASSFSASSRPGCCIARISAPGECHPGHRKKPLKEPRPQSTTTGRWFEKPPELLWPQSTPTGRRFGTRPRKFAARCEKRGGRIVASCGRRGRRIVAPCGRRGR